MFTVAMQKRQIGEKKRVMILRCGGKKRYRGAQSAHWPALWVAVGRAVCSALSSKQAAWEWCIQPNSFLNERACHVPIHPNKFLPNDKARQVPTHHQGKFHPSDNPAKSQPFFFFQISENLEEGATVTLTKSQARSSFITRQAHTQEGLQRAEGSSRTRRGL
jgi:hypothetical protein